MSLILGPHDHIVTAFADYAAGPGWANTPVHVIVRDGNGKLREEYLQPNEQSAEIRTLFAVSAATHQTMANAVKRSLKKARPA